jgi:hypothetical protein
MRSLSSSEKRTIRIAGAFLGACLLFFCGQRVWKSGTAWRANYQQLVSRADNLRAELKPYRARVEDAQKLMRDFHMDPSRLSRTSVVAEASAAILKAATTGGVQLGPIREAAARQSNKELTTIQLDCTGPVPAVMAFLHRFESIGYPILIDTVQLSPEPSRPGNLKLHVGIIILDFDQWKGEEAVPHA